MKLKLLFVLFIFPAFVFAGAREDLAKMNKLYIGASSCHFKFNVTMHMNKEKKNFTGELASEGKQYYLSLMGVTTVMNDDYAVQVNTHQQVIVYQEMKKNTLNNALDKTDFLKAIDSILKNPELNISYAENTADKKVIVVKADKDAAITEYRFTLNKDFHLVNFTYTLGSEYASSASKVEINYTSVSLNKAIDKKVFSEKKFISGTGNKMKPQSGYEKYRIINQGQKD